MAVMCLIDVREGVKWGRVAKGIRCASTGTVPYLLLLAAAMGTEAVHLYINSHTYRFI